MTRGGKYRRGVKDQLEGLLTSQDELVGVAVKATVRESYRRKLWEQCNLSNSVAGKGVAIRVCAKVQEYIDDDGLHVVTVEVLEGEDLQTLVAHRGRLLPGVVLNIARQLATTLDNVTPEMLFPSLCPRNIFLSSIEGKWLADIVAFVQKSPFANDRYDLKRPGGSVEDLQSYDPPERVESGFLCANDRSYVWSFGLIVFYMLVGRCFWLGESLDKIREEICAKQYPKASARAQQFGVVLPTQLDDWFAKCISAQQNRFATVSVATNALAAKLLPLTSLIASSGDVPGRAVLNDPSGALAYLSTPAFESSMEVGPPSLHSMVPSIRTTPSTSPALRDDLESPQPLPVPLTFPNQLLPVLPPVASDTSESQSIPMPSVEPPPLLRQSPPAPPPITHPQKPFRYLKGGHEYPVKALAVSHSAQELFSGDSSGSIFGWDLSEGCVSKRFDCHESEITDMAMVPGHSLMVSTSRDGRVVIWNTDDPESRVIAVESKSEALGVAISPDGSKVVVSHADGFISVLSGPLWRDGVVKLSAMMNGRPADAPLGSVAVDRSGRHAYALDAHSKIHVWDLQSSCHRRHLHLQGGASYCMALLDDRRVITGGTDGIVRVTNVHTGQAELLLDGGHKEEVRAVLGYAEGKTLISCDTGGRAILWDLARSVPLREFGYSECALWDIALAPGGELLFAACADRSVVAWDGVALPLISK